MLVQVYESLTVIHLNGQLQKLRVHKDILHFQWQRFQWEVTL